MLDRFLVRDILEHALHGQEPIFDGNVMTGFLFCSQLSPDSTSDDQTIVLGRACVVEKDQFWGGSVMIWGGISLQHKTDVRVKRATLTR